MGFTDEPSSRPASGSLSDVERRGRSNSGSVSCITCYKCNVRQSSTLLLGNSWRRSPWDVQRTFSLHRGDRNNERRGTKGAVSRIFQRPKGCVAKPYPEESQQLLERSCQTIVTTHRARSRREASRRCTTSDPSFVGAGGSASL